MSFLSSQHCFFIIIYLNAIQTIFHSLFTFYEFMSLRKLGVENKKPTRAYQMWYLKKKSRKYQSDICEKRKISI